MLVIKVDHFDTEPLEARLTGRAHILGIATDSEKFTVRPTNIAKLRRQENAVAAIADGPADEFFIAAHTVHVGGIKEIHPALERVVDCRNGFLVTSRSIKFAHSHAAKADRRNFGAILTELPLADFKHY